MLPMKYYAVFTFLLAAVTVQADVTKGGQAYAQGDKVGALAYYKAVENTPEGIKALAYFYMKEDELDDAEDVIVAGVKRFPDNPDLYNVKGVIMSRQAMGAVFSALSYAKKSKAGFAKAVELAPQNSQYRMDLVQFYLQAPGFAGGDPEQAWKHIQVLEKLDSVMAFQAKVTYYQVTEQPESLSQLVLSAAQHSSEPEVLLSAGILLMNQQAFEQSFATLSKIQLPSEATESQREAYYGAQYQMAKLAMMANQYYDEALVSIELFMKQSPQYRNPQFAQWAQYRYGVLLARSGEIKKGKNILNAIETQDKQLHKELERMLRTL
ncbi:MAG: hypothetical protein GJ671_00245 [Alteromonadaceae bacterium]|nr:hypothetical protein [Alteromonadaceae bacterium]